MANCFCVGNIFPARDREIDRRRAVHKEIDERVMIDGMGGAERETDSI